MSFPILIFVSFFSPVLEFFLVCFISIDNLRIIEHYACKL